MLHFICGLLLGIGGTIAVGFVLDWKDKQEKRNDLLEAELQALRNAMLSVDKSDDYEEYEECEED